MAIYHLSAKTISRSSGRTATGAAAYRAGEKIVDERTGEMFDYTRKGGVTHSELILPGGKTDDRADYWNRVEQHHKRGDAVLSREVEIALPVELTAEQRKELAVNFGKELSEKYGVAADVSIHEPHKRGVDHDNPHAHIMLSACYTQETGELGKKCVELDPIHCQRAGIENMADWSRERWAQMANHSLEQNGHQERIDHRTLVEQRETALFCVENAEAIGISPELKIVFEQKAAALDRPATIHLGPAATAMERRGEKTNLGDYNRAVKAQVIDLAKIRAEREQITKQLSSLDTEKTAIIGQIAQITEQERREAWKQAQIAKLAADRHQEPAAKIEVARIEAAKAAAEKAAEVAERQALNRARTRAWEAEQSRRSRYRANRYNIRFTARIASRLLPKPLGLAIEVAAEAIAAIAAINDWRQAQAYKRQVNEIKTKLSQVKAPIPVQSQPQHIVVTPEPPKPVATAPAKPEISKIQDVATTPEANQVADLRPGAGITQTTTYRNAETTAALVQTTKPFVPEAPLPAVDPQKNNLPIQQPAVDVQPVKLTMTGAEIQKILYAEECRIEDAKKELKTIPANREDAVQDLFYKHIPEWSRYDEKADKLDKLEQQCREREAAWLQLKKEKEWTYLSPLPPDAGMIEQFKRKTAYTLMSKEQLTWQNEGETLKEWRSRLNPAKASLEQERQELQAKTDKLAPQVHREADQLMTRRAELEKVTKGAQVHECQNLRYKFPSQDATEYTVTAKDVASLLTDEGLKQQIKERKELERKLDKDIVRHR